jgi:uncharacterized membrane protein YeaQ/YmgE (transglycosylase-associated protein family)
MEGYQQSKNLPAGHDRTSKEIILGILWIIVIGFIAGLIARFLAPGPNTPAGFVLTTVLGIAGAFVATYIGQTIGWYRLDQGAGLIGATLGAIVVLFVWNRLVAHQAIADPGNVKTVDQRESRRWL